MRTVAMPTFPRLVAASRPRLRLLSPVAVLAVLMAALVLAVPPEGDFPVNDDWLHAQVVRALVTRGGLELPAWLVPTLVLQALWGGLFASLFGFSYTVLRVSTLVLAGIGVLGCYVLLRDLLDERRALIGALLLLVNPLYVTLSYSFMTDVPFLSLAIWSLVCYARALRGQPVGSGEWRSTGQPWTRDVLHPGWLAAGSFLAGAAYLVRQLGVALPLTALGSLLLVGGWRIALRPRNLATVFGPFVPAVLVAAYFTSQRGPVVEQPVAWTIAFWTHHGIGMVGVVLARLAETLTTVGLFTLPISAGLLASRSLLVPGRWRRALGAGLLLVLLAGFFAHAVTFDRDLLFPHAKNVLDARGFRGDDHYNGTLPDSILVPGPVLLVVTIGAVLGSGLLVLCTVRGLSRETLRGPAVVPLLFGLIALALAMPYHDFFDRYVIAVLPSALLVALLARVDARWTRAVAVIGIVLLAGWSIWWERDYLERRAALWQAGLALVSRGIPPEEIDGGFEWNGWYRGPAVIAAAAEQGQRGGKGSQLRNSILQELDGRKARWAVAFDRPSSASAGRVLDVIRYGAGQKVFAIQRF